MIVEGRFKNMSMKSGYGFFDTPKGDAIVMISNIPFIALPIDSVATIEVEHDAKGLQVRQILTVKELGRVPVGSFQLSRWYKGVVRWFSQSGGYGWIDCPAFPNQDVYLHAKHCARSGLWRPRSQMRVSFRATDTCKGPSAVVVKVDEYPKWKETDTPYPQINCEQVAA